MKTSAAQSLRKFARLLQSNSAQLFRIRNVQQLLRSNAAMEMNASVAPLQRLSTNRNATLSMNKFAAPSMKKFAIQ